MNCLSYQDMMSFARWVESLYRAQLQSTGEPSTEPSSNSNDSHARSEIKVGPPTIDDWRVAWGADRYPWGDGSPSCERAIFFEGSPACGGALSPAPTCSTRRKREGAACDLAGNLWEWLAWDQSQRDAPLITGGGWSSDSADLNRDSARPEAHDTHAPHIGARLVITLPIASLEALARREPSAHTPKSGAP